MYGILRPAATWNPVVINFKHIWQIFKDAYRANSYWDKLRIWFMPTGWRPVDLAEKFPVMTIENPFLLKKYSTENSNFLLGWSYLQLFVTSALMFLIFLKLAFLTQTMIFLLAGLLILHVMAYTFLLDGKKIALILEGLKFVFGIALFFTINERIGFIPNFSLNLIFSYLFISLGMTTYFGLIEQKMNKEAKS